MGILDWFRGAPEKKSSNLPAPTSAAPKPSPPIPSDLPPIRAEKPKASPSMDEKVVPYTERPKPMPPVPKERMAPKPVMHKPAEKHDKMSAPKMPPNMSHMFISSDEYAAVMDHTNKIRSKLLETDERLQSLSQLRSAEEKELLKWQEQLANLEKKLTYMETILEKAGEV